MHMVEKGNLQSSKGLNKLGYRMSVLNRQEKGVAAT